MYFIINTFRVSEESYKKKVQQSNSKLKDTDFSFHVMWLLNLIFKFRNRWTGSLVLLLLIFHISYFSAIVFCPFVKSPFKLFNEYFLREGQIWEATNGLAFDLLSLPNVYSSLSGDFLKWQMQDWLNKKHLLLGRGTSQELQ